MSNQYEQLSLDDVLDAFVASVEYPDHAAVTTWVRRYPQYTQELMQFAVSWVQMEILSPVTSNETVSEETLVLRGVSIVQNILHEQRQKQSPADPEEPIPSLVKVAEKRGIDIAQLADQVELSISLIGKLNRRLIRPASIPMEVLTNLANALQRKITSIAHYFQQPPTFASGALHRSEQAPVLAEQEDFFDAVRKDRAISEERRQRWLALSPRGEQ